MNNHRDLCGSLVALVTPMLEGGAIDWDSLNNLLEWHLDEKTDGIVAVGTTGESPTLNNEEHKQVIAHITNRINGRIPVIAGTGSNSTREAIDLTTYAKECGADAVMLIVPYYNKPTQNGLVKHFSAIAEAVNIPQIVYNVPSRTITDLMPETLGDIAGHKNIIGIKEATGDIRRVKSIHNICGNDFLVLSGDDITCCDLMLNGARGCISVTANVEPKKMHLLCELATTGKTKEALALQKQLSFLHDTLFLEANPIPVKYALSQRKMIQNFLRLPLTPLSAAHEPRVNTALKMEGNSLSPLH